MAIKVVTSFSVLCSLAREFAEPEKSGNQEKIEIAKVAHDNYKQLCLDSDEMTINTTPLFKPHKSSVG
jgi:hypothetical protein